MKICLIGPSYPFRGGISHYTTMLFKHLRTRHSVAFFSFKRQYPKLLFPGKTDIDPSKVNFKQQDTQRILDSMNPLSWLVDLDEDVGGEDWACRHASQAECKKRSKKISQRSHDHPSRPKLARIRRQWTRIFENQ